MRKKQTRKLYVTLAITIILSVSILFITSNQFHILLAQNNNSKSGSNNTTLVKAAMPIKNPYILNSSINKGLATMKPTSGPTPPDATNILNSFLNPKNLLGTAMNQIRNSTVRNDNSSINKTTAVGNANIFVQNPGILELSHQIIPPHEFIPVYDAMPYKIMNGQLSAKLPCDSNSKPSLQILAGQFSELKPAQLKLITALSHPGYMCMYYANISSTNNDTLVTTNVTGKLAKVHNIMTSGVGGVGEGNATITYIELFNPTEYRVVLPSTASLSVSVNQITPIERLHHIKGIVGLNQTTLPTVNQTTIKNTPNQLTRIGVSPSIAFVYNAWNPFLKQKTYLPIAPLVNETILSNSKCTIHAIWQSPKEEQSDLAELKEYSIVTNKNGGSAPMLLNLCGGAPIP